MESFSDHDGSSNTPDLFGEGTDTIGYRGEALSPYSSVPGIYYYDETAWLLLLDSVSSTAIGKTICLDAADDAAPHENWRWVMHWEGQFDTLAPSWDGPYCYEIVADCGEGMRGNINLDLQGGIDISDLTLLVGLLFRDQGPPRCFLEADVNADSVNDILDLTALVDYMFRFGPEGVACP